MLKGSLENTYLIKNILYDSKDEHKKMQPYLFHKVITYLEYNRA